MERLKKMTSEEIFQSAVRAGIYTPEGQLTENYKSDRSLEVDDVNSPTYILENGTKIKTNPTLGSTRGMMIYGGNLARRKPAADGVITGVVPGHGGDVYWVRHDDGSGAEAILAAYSFTEFELAETEKRHEEIAAYAKEMAGTDADLEAGLEQAGVEHWLKQPE